MAKKRKLEASPSADRAELRRLLEAAKADHHDDGPRLALADWLEEHGGEADRARAEVIRFQLDTDAGGPDWALSVERLREKHIREWVGAGNEVFRGARPLCRRGLLEAGVSADAWMAHDGAALASSPQWAWVESARFQRAAPARLAAVLASGLMAAVPRLHLGEAVFTRRGLAVLCSAPAFSRLRALHADLRPAHVGPLGITLRLADAGGLDELALSVTGDGEPDWHPLASAESLAPLRRLSLSGLDDAATMMLAGSGAARGLTELAADTRLGPAGVAALARSQGLAGLRRLSLDAADPEDAFDGATFHDVIEELSLDHSTGEMRLARRPPRLRRLRLGSGSLDARMIPALARIGLLRGLDELDLPANALGAASLGAVLAASDGPRTLRLDRNRIGDDGAAALAAWPGLSRVRHLVLRDCGLGNAGLRALAASPHAGAMEALDLAWNSLLTPVGVRALLAAPAGARLRWLSLIGARQPEECCCSVAACPPAGLRELWCGGRSTDEGRAARAALRARLPDCAIG